MNFTWTYSTVGKYRKERKRYQLRIRQTRSLFHRLLLSFYCHLVYSLLSRQTHWYILIKSKAIEQRYTLSVLVINRWYRSTCNYHNSSEDRAFTFNIHVLHNDLSISTETCIMNKKKAEFCVITIEPASPQRYKIYTDYCYTSKIASRLPAFFLLFAIVNRGCRNIEWKLLKESPTCSVNISQSNDEILSDTKMLQTIE